jgi:cell division protein ZapB
LYLLTAIPLAHYSVVMIPDFQLLSEKINELAALTQALRRENADLRAAMITMVTDNTDMAARMEEAHQRVTALLEQLPAPDTIEEQDEEHAT